MAKIELPEGLCVFCRKHLGAEQWAAQEVVGIIGTEGAVLCCDVHIENPNEYALAVRRCAEEKAKQILASQN